MSDDRFKELADRMGDSPEKKWLIEKGLRAAKEGRDADLLNISEQLSRKSSKSGGRGCLAIASVLVGIFIIYSIFMWSSGKKTERIDIKTSIAIVNVESANIRAGTSTNHRIIGKVKRGDTLQVLSEANGWLLVKYKNSQGYIARKLVDY